MRSSIAKFALAAALPLFMLAGSAAADAIGDELLAMCKAGDQKPESCECQVKALTDNVDPKALAVLAATGKAENAATPEEKAKIIADALAAAGLTQEEYEKLLGEGAQKAGPAMAECSK
ncbi:hypothetical protein sos41_23830 [Alphaproteobacteria bacterium SO-S41]|nr:hypothetical protein sos41_23830 [Alphaproteobacteria bacterium SO-S41]